MSRGGALCAAGLSRNDVDAATHGHMGCSPALHQILVSSERSAQPGGTGAGEDERGVVCRSGSGVMMSLNTHLVHRCRPGSRGGRCSARGRRRRSCRERSHTSGCSRHRRNQGGTLQVRKKKYYDRNNFVFLGSVIVSDAT